MIKTLTAQQLTVPVKMSGPLIERDLRFVKNTSIWIYFENNLYFQFTCSCMRKEAAEKLRVCLKTGRLKRKEEVFTCIFSFYFTLCAFVKGSSFVVHAQLCFL